VFFLWFVSNHIIEKRSGSSLYIHPFLCFREVSYRESLQYILLRSELLSLRLFQSQSPGLSFRISVKAFWNLQLNYFLLCFLRMYVVVDEIRLNWHKLVNVWAHFSHHRLYLFTFHACLHLNNNTATSKESFIICSLHLSTQQ